MQLMEWLKKNEKLVFWNRCRLHCNEPEFRKWVIDDYYDPDLVRINTYGDEYRGQMIYHIGEYACEVGFFSEVIFTLFRLFYADDRGMIPYVNWGKGHLYYEPDGIDGEKNVFLYYFEPASQVKSIEHAAYVIHATYEHIHTVQDYFNTHGYDVTNLYMQTLTSMVKKYLKYNEKTENFLKQEYEALIGDKKALAVHFRGTDYRRQYNNHPVFVTIEQEIEEITRLIEKNNYEVIFLATDEQEAISIFRDKFGEMLKVYEDTWRACEGDESVAYSHSDRKNHHYLLGLEVLRDQYTLTRCQGIVCGVSNLTIMARVMRKAWYEPYENMVIIDNGICANEKAFCDAKH